VNTLITFSKHIVLILVFILIAACKEDPPDREIAQFHQPEAVALVCFNEQEGVLPLSECTSAKENNKIYAFVTQTVFGEVAVVSISDYKIIDQENRIPFNSYIPVGGQPLDIAVSASGKYVFTANYETMDISVIDLKTSVEGSNFNPGRTLFLGEAPGKILVHGDPEDISEENEDFLFVTIPSQGKIAVLNIDPLEVEISESETMEIPSGVLAYIKLDAHLLSQTPIDANQMKPGGIWPYAMAMSVNSNSLYVAGKSNGLISGNRGSYVAQIDREVFIDAAIAAYSQNDEVSELSAQELGVKIMDLGIYTARDISIEPGLERWMYIVEQETGGIIVLDLETEELLDVNSWNPLANDPYSISIPGVARKVKLLRFREKLAEDELPDRTTFNGTYALVSTTIGGIYVIDVDVNEEITAHLEDFSVFSHSLHSGINWFSTTDLQEDDLEVIYPQLKEAPTLSVNGERFADNLKPFKPLHEDVEEYCVNGEDYKIFENDKAHNIYFKCDRRISSSENWTLNYQGRIGVSGVATIKKQDNSSVVHVTDQYKNYCAAGVLGPAGDDLWGAYGAGADEDSLNYEAYRGYKGDYFEIFSDPIAFGEDVDCQDYLDSEKPRIYQIDAIIDSNTLSLKALDDELYAPLPNKECYSQAFSYDILAQDSWILQGSSTGIVNRGSALGRSLCSLV
jgi:hypothetical protein